MKQLNRTTMVLMLLLILFALINVRPTLAEVSGQIIVDPDNPRWLVYNRDSNGDGKKDPFFLAGPGDPENFLYRGTRNADGTRTGDQLTLINKLAQNGGNSIYLMAVRSHGGDGGNTENPFIDSDPSKGLDQDILNQWDTWFAEMDKNGILIFFYFYDDSACIWKCDKLLDHTVPAVEKEFIGAIVQKFSKYKHLIWVIAEESNERYSEKRVSNIAKEIKAFDINKHVVASHQRSDLVFKHADDPNIDQFAMQYNPSSVTPQIVHDAGVKAWNNANGRYNVNYSEIASGKIGTGATARRNVWGIVTAGAYAMLHGMDIASTNASDLQDLRRVQTFFEATNFNVMSPHDELKAGSTQFVLAKPGSSYILYTAAYSGSVGLTQMTSSTYSFKWMDTVTGNVVNQSGVSVGSGTQTWAKPSGIGNELALYVQIESNGNIPTSISQPSPTSTPKPTSGSSPTSEPEPTQISDRVRPTDNTPLPKERPVKPGR